MVFPYRPSLLSTKKINHTQQLGIFAYHYWILYTPWIMDKMLIARTGFILVLGIIAAQCGIATTHMNDRRTIIHIQVSFG